MYVKILSMVRDQLDQLVRCPICRECYTDVARWVYPVRATPTATLLHVVFLGYQRLQFIVQFAVTPGVSINAFSSMDNGRILID